MLTSDGQRAWSLFMRVFHRPCHNLQFYIHVGIYPFRLSPPTGPLAP